MKMCLTECLSKFIPTTVFIHCLPKKLYINMFENWQGINPMGLSAPWADYKNKQLFKNVKM